MQAVSPTLKGRRLSAFQRRRCALLGALAVLFFCCAPSAIGATTVGTLDGRLVEPAAVEANLARTPVLVTLNAGEAWSAYGVQVTALEATQMHVSVSSQFISFAVVSGRSRVGLGGVLRPGQTAVLVIGSGELRVLMFDAERLAASASPAVAAALNTALAPVIAAQRRGRFWGMYEPAGLNARAAGSPATESIRRGYLVDPIVISARLTSHGDTRALGFETAGLFLRALQRRDSRAAAALLDPLPFSSAGDSWALARLAFADRTFDQDLARRLAGARIEATGEPNAFRVVSAAGVWTMRLADRDGAVFVASLEPA